MKSGILVERRAAVGSGCRDNVTGDVRGGVADGDVVGRGCGVADGGEASTDLADFCPVGQDCLGHDSDASSLGVAGVVGVSCRGCSGGCGGVGDLPPGVACRPPGAGVGR